MDPASAQAALQAFLALEKYLKHQRGLADYFFTAAPALMVYDYLLTVHDEIRLVWFSPWSYTKVLFLLVRYLPFIGIYFDLHNQILLGSTAHECKWMYPMLMWVTTIAMFAAILVLTIRTWAVWRRDLKVGILLAALTIGAFVAASYCNAKFNKSLKISDAPLPGMRGCFVTGASTILRVDFIASAILEFSALILMMISAYKAYKIGDTNQLSTVLHRDGIIYYIFLLIASIANVTVMSAAPIDLMFMMIPVCGALYQVLTCRIVLNIRNVGSKDTLVGGGTATQLHSYHSSQPSVMPMVFRPAPKNNTQQSETMFSENNETQWA